RGAGAAGEAGAAEAAVDGLLAPGAAFAPGATEAGLEPQPASAAPRTAIDSSFRTEMVTGGSYPIIS
ncbi:hypothetical protein, partial [Streptomyces sp. NPDC005877]|uniref:hypothetical protein n=1 Tax=Streptomyces sp. NPDC005877 TaxID=3155346 RepID=UPI0033F8F2B1